MQILAAIPLPVLAVFSAALLGTVMLAAGGLFATICFPGPEVEVLTGGKL
jgi:hypothetical protein